MNQPFFKCALAVQFHQPGSTAESVTLLDVLGEVLAEKGDTADAIEVIRPIILMNPPDVEKFRHLLKQMQKQ